MTKKRKLSASSRSTLQGNKQRLSDGSENDSEDDYSLTNEDSHRGNNSKRDDEFNMNPIDKEIVPDIRSISTLASSIRTIPEKNMNQEEKMARMETIYSYSEDEDEFEVAKVKKWLEITFFV